MVFLILVLLFVDELVISCCACSASSITDGMHTIEGYFDNELIDCRTEHVQHVFLQGSSRLNDSCK